MSILMCAQKLTDASLIYHTEPKTNTRKMKKTRRQKWICSEETVPGKKPWSQSGGGKEVEGGNDLWNRKVLSLEWNRDGLMDNDSGESTEEDEVAGVGRDESELE